MGFRALSGNYWMGSCGIFKSREYYIMSNKRMGEEFDGRD